MNKTKESKEDIPSLDEELEALESKFSEVRGNEIMEEVMDAAKEYLTEKGDSNDSG